VSGDPRLAWRWRIAPVATGAALALAGASWPAGAEPPSGAIRIYLPFVQRTVAAEPEPCGPVVAGICPGGSDWVALCGGMGRIRDMVAIDDEHGTVLAVGDGTARFTLGKHVPTRASPLLGDGRPVGWTPQIGQELTGLNALYVHRVDGRPQAGWAVGDHGQLIGLNQPLAGCWSPQPEMSRQPDKQLYSIRLARYNGDFVGWAVGDTGHTNALALEIKPTGPSMASEVETMTAMLTDVALDPIPAPGGGGPRAWAVGADPGAGQAVFLRTDDTNRWSDTRVASMGWPRELVAGHDNDAVRAFGETWDGGAVIAWKHDAARGWELDEGFRREGHRLVDAYSFADGRTSEIWLGLNRRTIEGGHAEDRAVVERYRAQDDRWRAFPAPEAAPAAAAGPESDPAAPSELGGAIAAIRRDGHVEGVLHAWGDTVWLLDVLADPKRWTRVRQRHDLVEYIGDGGGGRLLAASGAGGLLLRQEGDTLYQGMAIDALDEALAGAPMRAMAVGGGATWIVGDRGLSVRMRGPMARAQVFALPDSAGAPDFVDVDVTATGEAWAVSHHAARDRSHVWWFDAESSAWREQAELRMRRLNAIAALPGGYAWAVGDGAVVQVTPRCTLTNTACACDEATGRQVCKVPSSPRPRDNFKAAAVAALSPTQVWEGGEHRVLRAVQAEPVAFADVYDAEPGAAPSSRSINVHLRTGARIVDLAATGPGDVWAVAQCGRDRHEVGNIVCGAEAPFMSTVLHYDGWRWQKMTTVNAAIHDIDVAVEDGRRTVWLAGDWTTLIRYRAD